MNKILITSLLVVWFFLAFGCAEVPKVLQLGGDPLETPIYKFKVVLADEIMYDGKLRAGLNHYNINTGVYTITILKDEYPRCLQHEVRHILEGNFHEGYESYEDCFE